MYSSSEYTDFLPNTLTQRLCFRLVKFVLIHHLMPQVNFLKNYFKIYIQINIKTAPTCFGAAVTPSSGSALLVLDEVTFVKIAN